MTGHYLTVAFIMLTMLGCIPGSTAQEDYYKVGLDRHNEFRAKHAETPPMTSDPELNEKADKCAVYYANRGTIDHSCPYKDGAGENIYASGGVVSGVEAVSSAVGSWYAEIKYYDFEEHKAREPCDWSKTGHFTQVVWKSSTQLGSGHANDPSKQWKTIVVGLYKPTGNYPNLHKENVLPLITNMTGSNMTCPTRPTTSGSNRVWSSSICAFIIFAGLLAGKLQ